VTEFTAAYHESMLRQVGRLLQLLALVILPVSMVLQLTNTLGRQLYVSEMVIMLVFGVAAFGVGRIIEGYATRSGS
jgi:hypothetical protein